jgi:excisionase family DNA binding protein
MVIEAMAMGGMQSVGQPNAAGSGRARANVSPSKEEADLNRKNQIAGSETVMTLHEVARYLRCHESTVYRLTKRGELPAFRLGAEWRFLRSKIEDWIIHAQRAADRAA